MDETTAHYFSEYQKLLATQNFEDSDLDYKMVENHMAMLETLGQVSNSAVSLFDFHKKEHIYLSPHFAKTLHYDLELARTEGNNFFDSKVHPEDMLKLLVDGITLLKLCFALSPEKRAEYKLINEYRIKNGKGVYVRVIEQHQVLLQDKKGNIWLALSIMDIAPDQNTEVLGKSRLINFNSGELYDFPQYESLKEDNLMLSNREKEVLALIANGLISKQIADKLFISVHTVNTHRQKILKKLNVSNTFEAIQYATKIGALQ